MEQHYPLHLLATFTHFFPSSAPQWILQADGHEVWVAAALAPDDLYAVASAEQNARASFSHQSAKAHLTVHRRPLARWARYPAGVIVTLTAQGVAVPGIVAAFSSAETFQPRAEYGAGLAFSALLGEVCQRPMPASEQKELVERVRREYIERG